MKSMSKFAIPLLTLAIGSATAYAQQPRDDDQQQPRSTQQQPQQQQTQPRAQQPSQSQTQQPQSQQRGAQQQQQGTASTAGAMALEQVVRNEPDMLEGKAVTTDSGQEIGEIDQIVTKMTDNMVYAVINTESDEQAAVKLSELTIASLEADISAEDLEEQEYEASEFEPVQAQASQSQAGQPGQAGQQPRTAQGGQQGQAGATAPGGQPDRQAGQQQSDMPALAQLAMSSPAELQGKTLTNEDGEELGEIQRIVRNRANNDYYAVVSASGNRQAAVPLEDLQIGKVVYGGDPQELEQQTFQESEYRAVSQVR